MTRWPHCPGGRRPRPRAPLRLVDTVTVSVDRSVSWGEPEEVDAVLADDSVAAELAPVAVAVAGAPTTRWWTEPYDVRTQHVVAWPDPDDRIETPRFA